MSSSYSCSDSSSDSKPGAIIPPHEFGYMPLPPSPPGGWGSFAQAQGPSQDPGYTPETSGGVGPSTSPFVGENDDDDDDDTD
nr:hypothetical protein CFP56_28248 [Quercus suber]